MNLSDMLLSRFCKYVKFNTASEETVADAGIQPSTESQWVFARFLLDELKKIGVSECEITDKCYVLGRLSANFGYENVPVVGFAAHMDTEGVTPENRDDFPKITRDEKGDTIISSTGETILGADDKAGIAEIITAVEYIIENKIPHGEIELMFSPDEETGHGMDNVPLSKLKSAFFYTLDGSNEGEVDIGCFFAEKSEIEFTGIPKHTGTARPDFVNSIQIASDFLQMLPVSQRPETTDGMQGFFVPIRIEGNMEKSTITLLLRDFQREGMEKKKVLLLSLANVITEKHPGTSVKITNTVQYNNMAEGIAKNPLVMDILVKSVKKLGIEPKFINVRGGTDGSRLTEFGIPCPNIWTGGHDFHSKTEWASLSQMENSCKTVINIVSELTNLSKV